LKLIKYSLVRVDEMRDRRRYYTVLHTHHRRWGILAVCFIPWLSDDDKLRGSKCVAFVSLPEEEEEEEDVAVVE